MAQPTCTELDKPPADIQDAAVWVRDQNWTQGQGLDPLVEATFIKRWSLDNGASWNVPAPEQHYDAHHKGQGDFDPLPGESVSGLLGFDFRGLIPANRDDLQVLFEVWASTHSRYLVQGDTDYSSPDSYDRREWGGQMVNGGPCRFPVTVRRVTQPPPPPPGLTFEQLRDHAKTDLAVAAKLVSDSGRKPRASAPRVYWAHRLLADPDPKAAFAALAKVWPT